MGLGSGAAEALVSLPLWARTAAALAVLAVPGLLMGAPFPMGLRALAPESTGLAWGWAANGVASVMGASAATLLAMEVGGSGLLVVGWRVLRRRGGAGGVGEGCRGVGRPADAPIAEVPSIASERSPARPGR